MSLMLTDAGRAMLADGTNRGTRAITITHMAIGDSRGVPGVDDSGRTTLRNERLRQAVGGASQAPGRIAATARFTDAASWDATEVGLIAQVGTDPVFLLAYCAVLPGGDALGAIAPGVPLVLAAVIDIVDSEAEVDVTLAPAVTIQGPSTFLGLLDTMSSYAGLANGFLRVNAAAGGVVSSSPADTAAELIGLMMNVRAYTAAGNIAVPDSGARRWLVIAAGAGGGGALATNNTPATSEAAGGASTLTGPDVNISAAGGAAGVRRLSVGAGASPASGTVTGARAVGLAIPGGGADGGGSGRHAPALGADLRNDGFPGALVLAWVNPMPGGTYAVSPGAAGAGAVAQAGQSDTGRDGGAGGAGGVLILEAVFG